MKEIHVDPEELFRALGSYGGLEPREAFRLHLHLIEGCPECLRRVLVYYRLGSLAELAAMADPLAELADRRRRAVAEPLLAWIETLPPAQRRARLREDPELHREEVALTLLERCRARWAAAPEEALHWGELALEVARRLSPGKAGRLIPNQLQALAWAYQGNALRVLSDLRRAQAAFRRASVALARGILDDPVEAEVLALEASLLRAQRCFDQAREAIDRAIQIFGDNEAWHWQGQALLSRAKIRLDASDPGGALADLRRAESLTDLQHEPRLRFVAAGVELHLLCELERFGEARRQAPRARRLAAEHGTPADRLRVRWCEGRAHAGLGAPAKAEAAFREVRRGFVEQANGHDAALVSLDLAILYAGQERQAEIKELAAEMLPLFESRDLHPEVTATLFLFSRAAWSEEVTLQLLRELRRKLQAAGSR